MANGFIDKARITCRAGNGGKRPYLRPYAKIIRRGEGRRTRRRKCDTGNEKDQAKKRSRISAPHHSPHLTIIIKPGGVSQHW